VVIKHFIFSGSQVLLVPNQKKDFALCLHGFEDGCDALASTDAHTDKGIFATGAT
jgi:hypothetical protein